MRKSEFKSIVEDGVNRCKKYMITKIMDAETETPIIEIVSSELIDKKVNEYMRATDDNLVFKNGDKVEDLLLTSNLNDLSWFIY